MQKRTVLAAFCLITPLINFGCNRVTPSDSFPVIAPSLSTRSDLKNRSEAILEDESENLLVNELLADQRSRSGADENRNELQLIDVPTGLEDFEGHSSPLSDHFNISIDSIIENDTIR